MSKIGKKEQKILNRIARKKMKDVEQVKDIVELKEEIKTISPGRPMCTTPEEMIIRVEEYISKQMEDNKPLTLAGLALNLGMSSETLRTYNEKDGFSVILRYYKDKILGGLEEKLFTDPKLFNSIRYYLNNNFSKLYADRTQIDANINQTISLVSLSNLSRDIPDDDITVVDGEVI